MLQHSACCVLLYTLVWSQVVDCDPSLAAVMAYRTDQALLSKRWGDAAHGSFFGATIRRGFPFARAPGSTALGKWLAWYNQQLDPEQSNSSRGYREVTRYIELTGQTCLHKLRHDREQLDYLMHLGKIPEHFTQLQQRLREAEGWIKQHHGESLSAIGQSKIVRLPSALTEGLRYNRLVHVEPAFSTAPSRAIRWRDDFKQLEDTYLAASPQVRAWSRALVPTARLQVMVMDQLLSHEALTRLRRFCLESTIWFDVKPEGYLGAYWDDGFATPLLLQIADELHAALPRIFKSQPLVHLWAYKYASDRVGINVHADVAQVNVNFWVTEDDANLEPGTGGLVVYTPEAPEEWGFEDFNNRAGLKVCCSLIESELLKVVQAHDMLKAVNYENVTIPYRSNRMVLFNSNLWHRTDKCKFKPEYAKRRINITWLFGKPRRKRVAKRPPLAAHSQSVSSTPS